MKQQKKQNSKKNPASKHQEPVLELEKKSSGSFIYNKPLQIALLLLVSFGFYFNTIMHEYALDDVIVITKNKFTLQGFSGIKDLLTKDTFDGYTTVKDLVAGGRYRPLSLVTFALETGFFGLNHPAISHFINVLLYCAAILMLFLFLDKFLFSKQTPLLAFLSTLIFAIHPIHTEVVANIKSRDELMALLLTLVSLYLFFTYLAKNEKQKKYLILSLAAFFLSLLSKENAVTFLAIIPLMLYFFENKKLKDAIIKTLPFLLVTFLYLFIRFSITGMKSSLNNDILNSPYLYAKPAEAFATKMEVMGRYLLLLVFPHPMSYDYTYNQIPYIKPGDIKFLVSFVVNIALMVYAFRTFKRKNIFSFVILFYFISISIVSNFVFDIGAPMGDRFLFQSSIGFAIALAYGILFFMEKPNAGKINYKRIFSSAFLLLIFVLSGFKTISRNEDWKNEDVLFIVDVKASPNSAHANMNGAVSYVNLANKDSIASEKQALFQQAILLFKKSIKINPKFADSYINMGATYSMMGDVENTALAWDKAKELSPAHPILPGYFLALGNMFSKEGLKYYQQKNLAKSAECYTKALKYNPKDTDALYNLGGLSLMGGDKAKAIELWTRTLQVNPNHAEAKKWLKEIAK